MNDSRSFRLTSSEFPSGVSWLLNFFVELDILIYNTTSIEDTWVRQTNGSYALSQSEEVTKQYVPALHDSSVRTFQDDIIVRWSHEFPVKKQKEDKVILVVRDGRDAVHSLFKRKNPLIIQWSHEYHERTGSEPSFLDWLRAGYGPLMLTPAEIWALFNYLWIVHTHPQDLLIIRFDDLKKAPEATVARVLSFMELSPDPSTVTRAIASSGFERTKKAEERYNQQRSGDHNLMIRKGALGEWLELYGPLELKTFGGFPSAILALFDYRVPIGEHDEARPAVGSDLSENWNQSAVLDRIPAISAQYRRSPRLERYWKKYKRRELCIYLRGKVISFLKRGPLAPLYAAVKKEVDLYRTASKRG